LRFPAALNKSIARLAVFFSACGLAAAATDGIRKRLGYVLCEERAFLIFWSVLYWLSPYTDQIAAGIQPMMVSCNKRQKMPENGLPMVKN
jgi:hypothetical protein